MIWRLMASVLMMSDTGDLSLVSDKSDWPSQIQCEQIRQDFYTAPPPQKLNGRHIVTKISATCVPVAGADGLLTEIPPLAEPLPPPPPYPYGVPYNYGEVPYRNYRDEDHDVMRPRAYVVVPRYMPNGSRMLAPPCGGRLPCSY